MKGIKIITNQESLESLSYNDIIEARQYMKSVEAKPCTKCDTLTIFGICLLCQAITIEKFCKVLTDDFLWSKWYGGKPRRH